MRLIIALTLAAVAYGLSFVMGYPDLTRRIVLVLIIGMVVGGVGDAFGAVLQGQENMVRQSASLLLDRSVASIATIGLIFLHATLPEICAIAIVTNVMGTALKYHALRPYLTRWHLPSTDSIRALAIAGLPFLGWSVFRSLYGETDPLVLGFITSDSKVGWYSVAFRIIAMALFFPAAVTAALLPGLSIAYGRGAMTEFASIARRMMSVIMLVGIPAGLLFLCMPAQLLAILHYPPSFAGSVPVLRIAGISVVLYFVGIVLGTVVISSDRQAKMLRASLIGALVGVPACFLFSYLAERWWGNAAIGAMTSDICLEIVLIVFYLEATPRGVFDASSMGQLFRYLLAALPMAILLLSPLGEHWGLWAAAPSVAAYILGCIIFKAISREDLKAVLATIRQKGARTEN